jgi:hypothetical protein
MEVRLVLPNLNEVAAKFEGVPAGARKAISRTINDGIRKARTEIKKTIGQVFNLKPTPILAGLKREFPAFSTPNDLFGLLHIEGYKFPVSDFGARDQFPAGVAFQEIKGRQAVLPHDFIRTMGSGHTGVFHRIDGTARLRIAERTGLSIPQMLENPRTTPAWQAAVESFMGGRLEHHVSYLLKTGQVE